MSNQFIQKYRGLFFEDKNNAGYKFPTIFSFPSESQPEQEVSFQRNKFEPKKEINQDLSRLPPIKQNQQPEAAYQYLQNTKDQKSIQRNFRIQRPTKENYNIISNQAINQTFQSSPRNKSKNTKNSVADAFQYSTQENQYLGSEYQMRFSSSMALAQNDGQIRQQLSFPKQKTLKFQETRSRILPSQ